MEPLIVKFAIERFAIALVGCGIASYYDVFNNRNVPNWLTYGMVALGVCLGFFDLAGTTILSAAGPALLSTQFLGVALTVFGPAVFLFLVGYYLYMNGQIGGADVLVFIAIALLVPQQPFSPANDQSTPFFSIPYVVTIFALSGILFSAYLFLTMVPRVVRGLLQKKVKIDKKKTLMSAFVIVLYGFFLSNMYMMRVIPVPFILIIALVLVSAFFVYTFRDFILEEYVIRTVPLDKIDEEDVLAIEKLDPELVKKHNLKKVLTLKELEKLKDLPIKEFPIYKNMNCFMPHVLGALLISMVVGDIFTFMMRLG
ncbi:MAG: prepilin peptidase [Candidatus Micrarchaeota archaeon]